MGKEKATASTVKDPTEKNLGKAIAKPTVNIVAERVTTQKKEKVTATATATATPTSPTVVRMVSLSQISIKDCYRLVMKIEGIFLKKKCMYWSLLSCLSNTCNMP